MFAQIVLTCCCLPPLVTRFLATSSLRELCLYRCHLEATASVKPSSGPHKDPASGSEAQLKRDSRTVSFGIDMGGGQNYGPLLGPLNTRCRIIFRNQKGTIILTTTHMFM